MHHPRDIALTCRPHCLQANTELKWTEQSLQTLKRSETSKCPPPTETNRANCEGTWLGCWLPPGAFTWTRGRLSPSHQSLRIVARGLRTRHVKPLLIPLLWTNEWCDLVYTLLLPLLEMSGRYKFTREEIREKLEELGYQNIPADKLVQFAEGEQSSLNNSTCQWGLRSLR